MSDPALGEQLDRIKRLIEQDDLDEAIDQLKGLLFGGSAKRYDEVILFASRYNRLRRDWRMEELTREQYDAKRNRLSASLIDMLKELTKDVSRQDLPVAAEVAMTPPGKRALDVAESVSYESILGINNLKRISWIGRGMQAARSVCRVLTPGGTGTGFLVAPNVVMTNHHVIPDAASAGKSFVEFNYQEDADGRPLETVRYRLSPDPASFKTSPKALLDYTLAVVLADPAKPPLESWGHLPLNANADPVPTELVVIIQHPNGGPKQIALSANAVMGTRGRLIHYTTDTMPGSSGSPVFNDSWQVIAIHHVGGAVAKGTDGKSRYVNEGILMSAIRPDAGDRWPKSS